MKKVRITVKKIAKYEDLMAKYENPIEHACSMELGQTYVCNGWERPEGFCESAWETVSPFVMTLAHGGENFYDGWMKNPKSAMISCNDGFRPVSFLPENMQSWLSWYSSGPEILPKVMKQKYCLNMSREIQEEALKMRIPQ